MPTTARTTRMIRRLLLLASIALATPALAQGGDVVISGGHKDGNYHAIAKRLRARLLAEHDIFAEVRASPGSVENLRRLAAEDDRTGLALTQADALAVYLREHPDFANDYVVMADVGEECVFLIASDDGMKSAADLAQAGERSVAVGHVESGPAVSWRYLTHLRPEYGKTAASLVDPLEGLITLAADDPNSTLAAVMLVQRPRTITPALQALLDNPDAYHLIPLREGDLQVPALPDGKEVYSFETVDVRKLSVDTLCTRGLLVASRKKLSERLRSQIAQTLLENATYIAPQPK